MGYLKSHHATKQEAQLQKVEQSAELQNAVNTLMNWLQSGELRISYYHFILIYDILQSIGIKITNDDIGLKYIASYLLLTKVEDIISISTSRFTHKTDQKINEIIYSAVQDSLVILDLLNSQLFASS